MVIAIIGILIALLLPAVQAAREAARRMQCTNNLKQWSLALQNYHDVNNSFPSGWNGFGSTNAISVTYTLLPFAEQSALYDVTRSYIINTCNPKGKQVPDTVDGEATLPASSNPFACQPPNVRCPSESVPGNEKGQYGNINYMSSGADWQGAGVGNGNSTTSYRSANQNPRAVFDSRYRCLTGWVFCPYYVGMGAIIDGTSNTACYSESTVGGPNANHSLVKVGVGASDTAVAALVDNASVVASKPGDCLNLAAGKTYVTGQPASSASSNPSVRKNSKWFDGYAICTEFHTILPPNSPSCTITSSVNGCKPIMKSASSYHSGGVNVALFDGSVRFVSDTVDCGNLATAKFVVSGPSEFGVWGALGSINGGETRAF